MRPVLAAFLLIVGGQACIAAARCPTPDASFNAFFARFQQDSNFRLDRVEWPLDLVEWEAIDPIDTDAEAKMTRRQESRDWYLKMEREGLLRWPRLFGQFFRFDEWNLCRG